jgi:hypothetical protein
MGHQKAHVGRQDLDSLGTIANGVYPEETPSTGSMRGVHRVLQGVRQINVYPLLHGGGAPLRLGPMSTPAVWVFASLRTQRTIGQKPVWYP